MARYNAKKQALYILRDMKREVEETGNLLPVEDELLHRIDKIVELNDKDEEFIDCLVFLGVRGQTISNSNVLFWQLGQGESLEDVLRFNQKCAYAYLVGYNMYCKYVADLYQLAIQCGKSSSMMNLYKAEMNNANRYLNRVGELVGNKRMSKEELSVSMGEGDEEW